MQAQRNVTLLQCYEIGHGRQLVAFAQKPWLLEADDQQLHPIKQLSHFFHSMYVRMSRHARFFVFFSSQSGYGRQSQTVSGHDGVLRTYLSGHTDKV